MTPHTALLSGPKPSGFDARAAAPVLIQVPSLAARARPAVRPAASRGRRRLRREVRVAASTMLFALPMSWALMAFANVGPEPARASATRSVVILAESSAEDAPRATISLEPSAIAGSVDSEAPIALPAGYLIIDGSEESAHAGH